MFSHFVRYAVSGVVLVVLLTGRSQAMESCELVVGRLVSLEGLVEVQHTGSAGWQQAKLQDTLCQGDLIRAGEHSRAAITLVNQAVLRIDQNTAMRLDNITENKEERSLINLLIGTFQSFSRKPRGFEVSTPYLNGSIEGTEFVFRVTDGESALTVLEGIVVASNDHGSVSVSGGESATAEKGKAPYMRTVVNPRDAVKWSLYYPPLISLSTNTSTDLQAAQALANTGDTAAAMTALDSIPETNRKADYHLYRAGLSLSVGQVSEAQADINRALAINPNAGLAYAQRAVINVVQNDTDAALADAHRAVELSPDSVSALIALSYAQQAKFTIPSARDTLLAATEKQPENALAWARLSELQLMLGDRKLARTSAEKAISLQPDLGRTLITLGFAALAEFRNDEAKENFKRAIELDSADPLPHLGLGLARISAGDLEQGRAEIELAVGLDSNNALLRSYLGKAYFEEKRTPLDSEQYAIAKQLDPADPTAYLYAGIAKQTENRPVEALDDLQTSNELNDNRAVYRGRLLLDKDRAARGTSIARAYKDLGFSQLGLNESTESISIDPSNSSAHRFLSDIYQGVRRREVARVSELFQAQLLQDVNVNPIQPSVSSTNLNIVTAGGPASAGFNEFTPLFERNKTQFDVTGGGGNNGTKEGEAVITSVHDKFSMSAGGYYYDTDGFRRNNNIRHEIYNAYGQMALTSAVNVQAEYRYHDSENGDLAMNFDPDDFDRSFERKFRENTGRIGLRFTPNPESNLLLSFIYSDRENETFGSVSDRTVTIPIPNPGFPPTFTFQDITIGTSSEFETDETSLQYAGQYLYQGQDFNITAGATYADVDQKFTKIDNFTFDPAGIIGPPGGVIRNRLTDKPTVKDARAYIYSNINMPHQVTWTLGVSYHDYDQGDINYDRINPKVGLQWEITNSLRFRAAYFKVVKPALASNRTLEPTQVAGFNQYFDDTNATRSERYGGAFDWEVNKDVFVGTEVTRRKLETPEFLFTSPTNRDVDFLDWDEWSHRVYAYWTPADSWSLSAEAMYDKYDGDRDTNNPNLPLKVRTFSFPVRAQYFHPCGFFAGAGVTYVDQKVDRQNGASFDDGDSDFAVGDVAIGYRFPNRMGIASLSIQNLADEDFDYQDDSFREFQDEPSTGPYIPDRTFMGRITLNF